MTSEMFYYFDGNLIYHTQNEAPVPFRNAYFRRICKLLMSGLVNKENKYLLGHDDDEIP
jgi:hypothetical protein